MFLFVRFKTNLFSFSIVALIFVTSVQTANARECNRWVINAYTIQTGCCIVPEGTTFSNPSAWARELNGSWHHCTGRGPDGGPHCSGIGWAWWIRSSPWMEPHGTGFKSKICWRVFNEKHDRQREVAFDVDFNFPVGAKFKKFQIPSKGELRKPSHPSIGITKPRSFIAE